MRGQQAEAILSISCIWDCHARLCLARNDKNMVFPWTFTFSLCLFWFVIPSPLFPATVLQYRTILYNSHYQLRFHRITFNLPSSLKTILPNMAIYFNSFILLLGWSHHSGSGFFCWKITEFSAISAWKAMQFFHWHLWAYSGILLLTSLERSSCQVYSFRTFKKL